MCKTFQGQVILVTGAASPLGMPVCRRLIDQGATVIVSDRCPEQTKALALSLGKNAKAQSVDITDPDDVRCQLDRMAHFYGGLHGVLNIACGQTHTSHTDNYPLDDWHHIMALNVHGIFHVMKYAIALMVQQGGGAIVNLAAQPPGPHWSDGAALVAANHALLGMTQSAALEYGRCGLRINALGTDFLGYTDDAPLTPNDYASRVGLVPAPDAHSIDAIAELACQLLEPLPGSHCDTGQFHLLKPLSLAY